MYRAVAVYLTESDISASDEDLVEKSIADISVEIKYEMEHSRSTLTARM